MKFAIATLMTMFSFTSMAAEIQKARYNPNTKSIELEVRHGGGCDEHFFSLDVGACAQTFPVQCEATLVHETHDTCEAYIGSSVSISLKEAGLNKSYYSGASLTITYGNSEATVRLPRM
jgi:hypothetical protein